MKTRILLVGLAALAASSSLLSIGCGSTDQIAAANVYAAGIAAANDNLRNDPTLAPVIQDVAAKLPHVFDGSLSIKDRGALQSEIDKLVANNDQLKHLFPADSKALDDAKAYLAGVLQYAGSSGPAPTLSSFVLAAAPTQFAKGLTDGVAYFEGKTAPLPNVTP